MDGRYIAIALIAGLAGAATAMAVIDRDTTTQVLPIPSVRIVEVKPPAPVAPAVAAPARMCLADPPATPIESWTMSENHVGPFHPCEAMTLAFVKEAMPGHDIKRVRPAMAGGEPDETDTIVVSKNNKTVVTITPAMPGRELEVTIHDRRAQTPWRVRVGDTLTTLLAHHRKLHCFYGASEWGELYRCRRIHGFPSDGWVDSFEYDFDLAPFGPYESNGQFNVRPDWLTEDRDEPSPKAGSLKIGSIGWKPAPLP